MNACNVGALNIYQKVGFIHTLPLLDTFDDPSDSNNQWFGISEKSVSTQSAHKTILIHYMCASLSDSGQNLLTMQSAQQLQKNEADN